MNTSRLLTTTVAALTVVGAGLVYAQTTTTTPGTTSDQAPQVQPTSPGTTGTGAATQTMPNQDTTQRSNTMPMAPDAQADRN